MSFDYESKMNQLGSKKIPFLFLIDFESKRSCIIPIANSFSSDILFFINGYTNYNLKEYSKSPIYLEKNPISLNEYAKSFQIVQENLLAGNSYLLNLTFSNEIKINLSLEEIFYRATAKYKILYKDDFVIFSPETFVQIKNNYIYSFPMKGTLEVKNKDAEKILIDDEKEIAEHYTIVDLIRNDLNRISKNVQVKRFRYIDKIKTTDKEILQVSSEIVGEFDFDYRNQIGSIIHSLLPAGSISGAPKKKTLEIIKLTENHSRDYYTGICGYFDGQNFDSGIMIRYIEKRGNQFFFKSGGGITIYSDLYKEYKEMIDKIYVPIY